MPGSLYLADTNILLRLTKLDHPEYPIVRGAVSALNQSGVALAFTLQNMTEFWNVSTRPLSRNGLGLSVIETENNVKTIERGFVFLPDLESVYLEW